MRTLRSQPVVLFFWTPLSNKTRILTPFPISNKTCKQKMQQRLHIAYTIVFRILQRIKRVTTSKYAVAIKRIKTLRLYSQRRLSFPISTFNTWEAKRYFLDTGYRTQSVDKVEGTLNHVCLLKHYPVIICSSCKMHAVSKSDKYHIYLDMVQWSFWINDIAPSSVETA